MIRTPCLECNLEKKETEFELIRILLFLSHMKTIGPLQIIEDSRFSASKHLPIIPQIRSLEYIVLAPRNDHSDSLLYMWKGRELS